MRQEDSEVFGPMAGTLSKSTFLRYMGSCGNSNHLSRTCRDGSSSSHSPLEGWLLARGRLSQCRCPLFSPADGYASEAYKYPSLQEVWYSTPTVRTTLDIRRGANYHRSIIPSSSRIHSSNFAMVGWKHSKSFARADTKLAGFKVRIMKSQDFGPLDVPLILTCDYQFTDLRPYLW